MHSDQHARLLYLAKVDIIFDVAEGVRGQAGIQGLQSGQAEGQVCISPRASILQQPQLQAGAWIIGTQAQVSAHGVVPRGQGLYEDMVVVLVVDLVSQQCL